METLDQNSEIQISQILTSVDQNEAESQKIKDIRKPDQDVVESQQDPLISSGDENSKINTLKIDYDEATLFDTSQIEQIFLKEYRQMYKLIESNQLKVYESVPKNKEYRIGEGFVTKRHVTSNMGKALSMMNAIKNDPRNNSGISSIGNFQYFDGYLREDHSKGIRIIRIMQFSDLNKEFQQYIPYVLIHFYRKQKYPGFICKKDPNAKAIKRKRRQLDRELEKEKLLQQKQQQELQSECSLDIDIKVELDDSESDEEPRTQYRKKLRSKNKKNISIKDSLDNSNMKEESRSQTEESFSEFPQKKKKLNIPQNVNKKAKDNHKNKQTSSAQSTSSQPLQNSIKQDISFQKNKPQQATSNQPQMISHQSSSYNSLNLSQQIQNSQQKIKQENFENQYKKVQFSDKNQPQNQMQQINSSFLNSSNISQQQIPKERQFIDQINSLKKKLSDLSSQLDAERYKALYFEDMYLQLRAFIVKQELNQFKAQGFKYSASIERRFISEDNPSIKIEEEQSERIFLD